MKTPLRVLIIEDSIEDTELLLQTLGDGGYDPLWERVETAVAMAAALDHHPWELVITADGLPHFSALDALRLLQQRGLDLPLLIVSGEGSEKSAVAAMKAGAQDYLRKDSLTRLVPVIARELREAHNRRTRQHMKQALRRSVERFRSLIENVSDVITVLAPDGAVRYASPSTERVLGYVPEELVGANMFAHVHADDQAAVRTATTHALHNLGVAHPLEFRFRHRDGSWRVLEALSTGSCDDAGVTGIVVNSRDISGREAQTAALRYQALHDALTDLPNRTLFLESLQEAIVDAQRYNKPLALLFLDLDRFREINDTFGHQWGDVLLQQIGPRLRSALRKSDPVARLGGDEFAVLLPTAGDATGATQIARRILSALEQPFVIEGHALDVSASIGIAFYPEHGADTDTLMRRADIAVYMAKRASSGYAFYTADQDHYSPERLILTGELRHAIEHDQLLLHYQPKAHFATGQVSHVEALVRWQHPPHGLLPPDRFVPLAEQTGLIKPLSLWVLNTALRQCHAWQQEGLTLHVAVNLSMRNLQDPRLPDIITELLATWSVAPTCLDVEITESALAADPERALEILTRLGEMGVRISIDDFGTGYSSLAYLKRLPVDEIKIDKSFVIGMTADDNDAAIVRSTIDLGHNLGLAVVAEGVENQATWDLLAALGCDFAQGYYLSRPVPAVELTHWLREPPWSMGGQAVRPLMGQPQLHRRREAG
ncbi:MAG: EAL domain-containing protein [Deltaproteobacteria bacterium]|nr:EAL domain-containing protein [Deltaproteobacteria bacterium]